MATGQGEEGMRHAAAALVLMIIGCGGESDPQAAGPEEGTQPQPKIREVAIQVAGMFKAGAAT